MESMQSFKKENFVDVLDVVAVIAIGTCLMVSAFVLFVTHKSREVGPKQAAAVLAAEEQSPNLPVPIKEYSPFDDMVLTGKAAMVWDATNGKAIFEKNSTSTLPLASLTKLVMALTASDIFSPDAEITIAIEDTMMDGDTGLLAGEKWRFKDLLDFTLLVSSNDGAHAIARSASDLLAPGLNTTSVFTSRMNQKAKEIGLNAWFSNETGLDETASEAGGYGTAKDMAALFEYTLNSKPELIAATVNAEQTFTSLDGLTHTGRNTDVIVDKVPGIAASKTGFSNLAGGNLVVAFTAGEKTYIGIILGSTYDGRFTDMEKLITVSRSL